MNDKEREVMNHALDLALKAKSGGSLTEALTAYNLVLSISISREEYEARQCDKACCEAKEPNNVLTTLKALEATEDGD